MSRFRARRGIGSLEGYKHLYGALKEPRGSEEYGHASRSRPQPHTTCETCHYWHPYEFISSVGLCASPTSRHRGESAFCDKPTEDCFVRRSLAGLDFMWCQDHRQTVHSSELVAHSGCRVFVSSTSLPVEDQMELTLAGD